MGEASDRTADAGEFTDAEGVRTAPVFAIGSRVGRFEIRDRIGVGGMGQVYGAFDPGLDREVAIKVMRTSSGPKSRRHRRIMAEARAMAKLSHPNVMPIYDVGEQEGRVYFTMPRIKGVDLRSWVTERRPLSEILRVFAAAGRGLAAAHDVGLAHRDFKPENVMLAADGRILVMDFGIAVVGTERGDSTDSGSERPVVGERTAAAGTLAYMAPERLAGAVGDTAADQFSFFVALYQAICRRHPFGDGAAMERVLAVSEGRYRVPPREAKVPTWLGRLIERGLRVDPAQRFGSMDEVVRRIERRAGRRGYVWIGAAAILGVTTGAITWGMTRDQCDHVGDQVTGAWDGERADAVQASFSATGLGYASHTAGRVREILDGYAARWVEEREESCRADKRGAAEARRRDLAIACLDDRYRELDELVGIFEGAGPDVVEQAVNAAARLRPPSTCRRLADQVLQADPEVAAQVADVRRTLVSARTRIEAGAASEALGLARQAAREAEGIEFVPLTAEVQLALGGALEGVGDYDAAIEAHREGFWLATESRADELAARAGARLVYLTGFRLGRTDEGQTWRRRAEAATRRAGSGGEAEARLLSSVGAVHFLAGEYEQAEQAHERALVIWREVDAQPQLEVARSLGNLAMAVSARGDHPRALEIVTRSLSLRRAAVGDNHPLVAKSMLNVGVILRRQRRLSEATQRFDEALAILEGALAPDHPDVAEALLKSGAGHADLGDYESAEKRLQRAREATTSRLGTVHLRLAEIDEQLAAVARAQGDPALAVQHQQRSVDIRRAALGRDNPRLVQPLRSLASLRMEVDELDEAAQALADSLRVAGGGGASGASGEVAVRLALVEVLLALGRRDEAIAALEAIGFDPDDLEDHTAPADALVARRAEAWIALQRGEFRTAAQQLTPLLDEPARPHVGHPGWTRVLLAVARGRGVAARGQLQRARRDLAAAEIPVRYRRAVDRMATAR